MPSPVVPASPSMNTLGLFALGLLPFIPGSRNEKPRRLRTGGVWLLPRGRWSTRVCRTLSPTEASAAHAARRPATTAASSVGEARRSRNHAPKARRRSPGPSIAPSSPAGRPLLLDQFVQAREAGGAVGAEIALFPPATHRSRAAGRPGAGRYPQRRHVAPGDRETRRLPRGGAGQQFGQSFPVEPPFGGRSSARSR